GLEIAPEPWAVRAMAIVVQSCLFVEIMPREAQGIRDGGPAVDRDRPIRLDVARPPDHIARLVLDVQPHAYLVATRITGSAAFGRRIEAGVYEEQERHQRLGPGIDVEPQRTFGVDLRGEPVAVPVKLGALCAERFFQAPAQAIVGGGPCLVA